MNPQARARACEVLHPPHHHHPDLPTPTAASSPRACSKMWTRPASLTTANPPTTSTISWATTATLRVAWLDDAHCGRGGQRGRLRALHAVRRRTGRPHPHLDPAADRDQPPLYRPTLGCYNWSVRLRAPVVRLPASTIRSGQFRSCDGVERRSNCKQPRAKPEVAVVVEPLRVRLQLIPAVPYGNC